MRARVRFIHTVLACAAAGLVASTAKAHAQGLQPRTPAGLEVESFAGIVRDPYDASSDGERSGMIAGIRLGVPVRGPVNVVASAAYASGEDVALSLGPSYYVYDRQWLLTMAGLETAYERGSTALVLGGDVGVAWRREVRAGTVGVPTGDGYAAEWSPLEFVSGSLGVRQRVARRVQLSAGVRAHVFDVLEGGNRVSPAVLLGLVIR